MYHYLSIQYPHYTHWWFFQLFATSNNSTVRIPEEYVILYYNDFISVGESHKGKTNSLTLICQITFQRGHFIFPRAIYEGYFPTFFLLLDVMSALHYCQYSMWKWQLVATLTCVSLTTGSVCIFPFVWLFICLPLPSSTPVHILCPV